MSLLCDRSRLLEANAWHLRPPTTTSEASSLMLFPLPLTTRQHRRLLLRTAKAHDTNSAERSQLHRPRNGRAKHAGQKQKGSLARPLPRCRLRVRDIAIAHDSRRHSVSTCPGGGPPLAPRVRNSFEVATSPVQGACFSFKLRASMAQLVVGLTDAGAGVTPCFSRRSLGNQFDYASVYSGVCGYVSMSSLGHGQ